MIVLRDYQQQAIDQIRDAFTRTRSVCYQLATGGGKTVIFGRIAQQLAAHNFSALIMAHRRELVGQSGRKLADFGVPHGICQAGHTRSQLPIQVGSVQTIVNRLDTLPHMRVVVVDEAHHATANTYRAILDHFPEALILGVTATPMRLDGKGLGAVFGELVTGPPMQWLIDQGHLSPYRYLAPPTHVDLNGVGTIAGDYNKGQLAAATDKATITGDAIEHYRRYMDGLPVFVFCVSVGHAQRVADAFAAAGYRAASVDGEMDRITRARRIQGLSDGTVQVLTSCDLIGEGLDVPNAQGAILLRPTKSLTVFLQQCGRALRPKRDGSAAILLDHVGNVERHGLPAAPREWSLAGCTKRAEPESTTTCKGCFVTFDKLASPRVTGFCPTGDEECPYLDVGVNGGGGRGPPAQVDGDLVELDPSSAAWEQPPWADGLNVAHARGYDWYTLLERADTMAKLHHIRRVRGYKSGWVRHVARERGIA